MKIVYITHEEILGLAYSGGIQCSKRNLSLLRDAFGSENIYVCVITKNHDYSSKSIGNVKVFYSKCNRNLHSVLNALKGRMIFEKKVENEILKHINRLKCDLVFFELSKMGNLQKRMPKNIKQVLFLQNIEKNFIKNQLRKRPEALLLFMPTIINEKRAIKYSDYIIALNKRDAALLDKYYNRSPDLIIPITFDDSFIEPENDKPGSVSQLKLLFIGSFFPSNEIGVTWFVNQVMPYVNAEFTIVGKGFERITKKLSRKNVRVLGKVEDLPQCYYSTDAIVSPILFGDGMKVKTAEALMYGKPIFATDEALEGYEVNEQQNIFRCNTPEEFITSINTYADKFPFISYDKSIRALFLEKYHTPSYIPILQEGLSVIIKPS